MDDWLWTIINGVGLLVLMVTAAFVWEKSRNFVSARVGMGRFYNSLPRPLDGPDGDARLFDNIERLGHFMLSMSTERRRSLNSPLDWEWHLGEDLTRMVQQAPSDRATLDRIVSAGRPSSPSIPPRH